MLNNGMRPVHPGEVLFEEFMKPAVPSQTSGPGPCQPFLLSLVGSTGSIPKAFRAN
jgi:hypothetical protein